MSEYTTPIGPLFELQRETIKRSVDMLRVPRDVRAELAADTVAAGAELQQHTLALTRESIQQSIDVAEIAGPASGDLADLRGAVDAVFDSLADQHAEAVDSAEQRYDRTDQELLRYAITQIDIVLQFNRSVETHVSTAFQQVEENATGEDLAEELEAHLDRLSEHLQRQSERFRDLEAELEAVTPPASHRDSDEEETPVSPTDGGN